jgi:hypothetical protein
VTPYRWTHGYQHSGYRRTLERERERETDRHTDRQRERQRESKEVPPQPTKSLGVSFRKTTTERIFCYENNQQDAYVYIQLRTAAFKAYCAIRVRRSNFRHQTSPRVSPRESTQRRKVELWAKNVREFCLNGYLQVTFRDLLHAVKLRHGTDGFTSPPKEGVLRIFSPTKSDGFGPGANPRTWVPKANTLPLDHRSR